jgi:hypothetical protein
MLTFNSTYIVDQMYDNYKKLAKQINIQILKEIYALRYLLYIFTTFNYYIYSWECKNQMVPLQIWHNVYLKTMRTVTIVQDIVWIIINEIFWTTEFFSQLTRLQSIWNRLLWPSSKNNCPPLNQTNHFKQVSGMLQHQYSARHQTLCKLNFCWEECQNASNFLHWV